MGPRAGLDRCGKSRPPTEFDPRTVQPIASLHSTKKSTFISVCLRIILASLYAERKQVLHPPGEPYIFVYVPVAYLATVLNVCIRSRLF